MYNSGYTLHTTTVALWCYSSCMDTTISQRELRNESGEIMRRVVQGESFIVTRNGSPIADLVPHNVASTDRRRPRFVSVDTIASGAAALPKWGTVQFAYELSDLDRAIDDREIDRWSTAE